jgi:hypothetical protein
MNQTPIQYGKKLITKVNSQNAMPATAKKSKNPKNISIIFKLNLRKNKR